MRMIEHSLSNPKQIDLNGVNRRGPITQVTINYHLNLIYILYILIKKDGCVNYLIPTRIVFYFFSRSHEHAQEKRGVFVGACILAFYDNYMLDN